MAKHFSFFAENVTPVSQNNRSSATITRLQVDLTTSHNVKYPAQPLPRVPLLLGELQVKVFYLHRVADYKDADNISKPLWDSLNKHAYADDKQIKYLETLKVDVNSSATVLLDVSKMDPTDSYVLAQFVLGPPAGVDRLLYVSVEDLDLTAVRL